MVDNGDGTWNWSLAVADVSATVILTGTDDDGAQQMISFELVVVNTAPSITRVEPTITVQEGDAASNSGTYFDPGIDAVVLTSSIGTMLDNGDGTWNWSLAAADQSATVTVTVTDGHGAQSSVDFELIVMNSAPTITVLEPTITVPEGIMAVNRGTYFDPGIDAVMLTSSIGSVIDNLDGSWNWSLGALDGPDDSTMVDITVTDASGAATTVSFQLTVTNSPPELTVDHATVTIQAGETAVNGGTFSDPGADIVNLASSLGTIVDNGDGTWSWSLATTDGPDDSATVSITATDEDGAQSTILFELTDHDLAEIDQIVVGDGTTQRSIVSKLEIYFDTEVDIDPTAFLVERLGAGGGVVATSFSTTVLQGRTVATITFSGSFVEVTGSLADGEYRLTIDGEKIRRTGTTSALDADGDGIAGGIRLFGEASADQFFRLFGDVDGDRDVDNADHVAFLSSLGSTVGQTSYDLRFDADGDGDIDNDDRLRFLQNYRRKARSVPNEI
jgi:hypothetical protein